MSKHIIKYEYDDGRKLVKPKAWCGHDVDSTEWVFSDSQHAILSIEQGSMIEPCKKCLAAISKVISSYID